MINIDSNGEEKEKILITGGTGFIGSHLIKSLNPSNIILLKRTTSDTFRIAELLPKIRFYNIDEISLKQVFEENNILGIIHLATDYGKTKINLQSMLEANICLPNKLLDFGVKSGVSFFINTHTFANNRYSLYSAMKHSFLDIARYYAYNNYDLKFVNMKLEYVYGPMDDDSKFIPFIFKNMLSGRSINATKCEQRRDFIFIDDVISAYRKVLDKIDDFNSGFTEFEIGLGNSISIKDFVSIIERAWGKSANINYGKIPYNKNEIFESHSENTCTSNLLSWEPQFDYSSGIKEMIKYYEGNGK